MITKTTFITGFLISCSICYLSAAETVYIPDANFKAALIAQGVDTNDDMEISYEEALAVTSLDVGSQEISDLTGIEFFTNLTVLNCYSNNLISIDISDLTGLQELRCFDNLLTSLDVSANTALIKLMCYDNPIGTLDVSNNTQVTHLYCMNNQLSVLDLTSNQDIQYLYIENNDIATIDISNLTSLKELICHTNQLTSLDVTNCSDLELLRCQSNQLTELNTQENQKLRSLFCSANELSELNLSYNPVLKDLFCGNNQFTGLDISNNIMLENVALDGMPELTIVCVWELPFPPSQVSLDINGSPNIVFSTSCLDYVIIPDPLFKSALIDLGVDLNGDGEISYPEADLTDSIDVNSKNIADLTGIQAFENLTFLWCYDNELAELDISALTALTDIDCGGNQLTELNVTNNKSLVELRCYLNQISALDLSQNNNIAYIDCGGNELAALDVSNNTSLTHLLCYAIEMNTLDISNNTNLEFLNISDLPFLGQVCVWELPFPPAGTTVIADNSPDVVYSVNCVTGIPNDRSPVAGIRVYPNPVGEILYIRNPEMIKLSFALSDITGKSVYAGTDSGEIIEIDIDFLKNGLYLLSIQSPTMLFSDKIIIN